MNVKERMEFRENLLNEYEKGILPPNNIPGTEEELQRYLNMDSVEIQSLDRESALSIAIRLNQFSIYIQRCINKEKSRLVWANQEFADIIGKQYNQFDSYVKYEARRAMVAQQDSAAGEISRIITFAEQRIARLDDLAQGIKNLGHIFSLLYKSKSLENR